MLRKVLLNSFTNNNEKKKEKENYPLSLLLGVAREKKINTLYIKELKFLLTTRRSINFRKYSL